MHTEPLRANVNRRTFIGSAAVGLAAFGSVAKDGRLYLLSAAVWPNGESRFPAVLFQLDSQRASVRWASTISRSSDGVNSVLYSFEERLLLVSGPSAVGDRWVLIPSSDPGKPRVFRLESRKGVLLRPHLARIRNEAWLTVANIEAASTGESNLRGVRLTDLVQRDLDPTSALRDLRLDGAPGGAYPNAEYADLYLPAGSRSPLLSEWRKSTRIVTDIVLPGGVKFSPRDRIVLIPRNGHFLALSSIDTRVRGATSGSTPIHVYDRRAKSWQSLQVPGGQTGFRAFGEWLCAHVGYSADGRVSPGSQQRGGEAPTTGPGFESYASDRNLFQPGLIWLYHVPTRRVISVETGQGDTEVLWVKEDHVLFRGDRTLYEARIDDTRLVDQRKLLERDFIADVHWVFYGPPSDRPPNPPWEPFELN